MRKLIVSGIAAFVALAGAGAVLAEEAEVQLPKRDWGFDGPFGTYDRAAAQRGFQVYKEVCSACHSLSYVHYRDLGPAGPDGGIGFSEEEVKAIAAGVQVTDGPNDNGEMFERNGRPYDKFKAPFANANAARASNNGALPPDLSLIVKAREGFEDYVYGILTGFADAPAGVKLMDGMNYNKYFPGHQIAMPPPLTDDRVTYADGTKATVAQEAHDVVTFLSWAAEPKMEERKRLGFGVMAFMVLLSVLLFLSYRRVWKDAH